MTEFPDSNETQQQEVITPTPELMASIRIFLATRTGEQDFAMTFDGVTFHTEEELFSFISSGTEAGNELLGIVVRDMRAELDFQVAQDELIDMLDKLPDGGGRMFEGGFLTKKELIAHVMEPTEIGRRLVRNFMEVKDGTAPQGLEKEEYDKARAEVMEMLRTGALGTIWPYRDGILENHKALRMVESDHVFGREIVKAYMKAQKEARERERATFGYKARAVVGYVREVLAGVSRMF